MKYLILVSLLFLVNLLYSQDDSTGSKVLIDTLIKQQKNIERKQDSLNLRRLSDEKISLERIRQLREIEKKLFDKANKSTAELKESNRQKKQLENTMDSLNSEFQKRSNVYDSLTKAQKDVSDSLNKVVLNKVSELDSLKKISAKEIIKTDSVKAKNDDIEKSSKALEATNQSLIAQIAKKEDSAHVIAEISLKLDTRDKNYKSKIHVDGINVIDKLEKLYGEQSPTIGKNKKKKFTKYSQLQQTEAEKILSLYDGLNILKNSVLKEVITRKSWRDSIPIDAVDKVDLRLKEVRVNVFEGMIREITVKTNYGYFRNLDGPIDLVHFGDHTDDRLYRDGEKMYEDEYLLLGEVINYVPLRSNNDLPYTQFDIVLTPDTPKHVNDTYWIKESTGINTYFDVAVFSDLKGLSGDANGLAQTMATAKFITNTRNVPNTARIPFNFVSFVGGLSKFDKEFRGTKLESGDSINRKDLLQRSSYYAGLKLNLIHWILSPKPSRLIQDIQFNIGYNFVGSKTLKITTNGTDSTGGKNNDSVYNTVTHNMAYFEPIVSLNRYRNFNMAVSLPFYFVNLKESSGIANRKMEYWARPSIELMYYSKRNSSSKVFFRYNHWINLKKKENAFIQMQLGYSANLGDLFKDE